MVTSTAAPVEAPHPAGRSRVRLAPLHWFLSGQSVLVLLLSINRLSPLTQGYALPYQALRWVDLTNMLVWPFASVALSYGTLRWLERGRRSHAWHGLVLLLSVYLLAAGYGDHEVTNYLHARFCPTAPIAGAVDAAGAGVPERLCEIVVYHDDDFSHLVFFAGFVGITLALLLAQAHHPRPEAPNALDGTLLSVNAAIVGLGVFANLAFEATGLDLPIVGLVATLAAGLWWRAHRRAEHVPVVVYVALAYGPSGLAVALAKAAGLS